MFLEENNEYVRFREYLYYFYVWCNKDWMERVEGLIYLGEIFKIKVKEFVELII